MFLGETDSGRRPEIGTRGRRRAAELRIATGAGERLVRVEPGERFGPDNDEARAEAERLIGDGYAGLITGHTRPTPS